MKCDGLKPLVFSIVDLAYIDEIRATRNFQNPHDHAVYKATEVDEAIAELKDENKLLKEHIANGDVSRITWIDEVIELKAKLHDAEMRAEHLLLRADNWKTLCFASEKANRQTLRALWLARAERAKNVSTFCYYIQHYGKLTKVKRIFQDQDKWDYVEDQCKKKADTFKEAK